MRYTTFDEEVRYRARCILGFRGVKEFETMPLCVNALNTKAAAFALFNEHNVVSMALKVANDTLFHRGY